MNDKSLEFKVGLTVFIAFLVCIVGLMWFEGFKIGEETYRIKARFPMVGGVKPGDAVSVNGVERGEVHEVELKNGGVDVTMGVEKGTFIPDDSKVILQAEGLLGGRIVSIVMGVSEVPVREGAVLEGVYEPGVSETFALLGGLMEDLGLLSENLGRVTELFTEEGSLRKALDNIASLAEELNTVIKDAAPDFRESAAALKSSAVNFDTILGRNSGRLERIIAGLDTTAAAMPGVVSRVDTLSALLVDISRRLKSKETTAGALINDREFLDQLQRTANSLEALIEDIKKNPGRYVKVEIF